MSNLYQARASRNIAPDEELLWYYGDAYWSQNISEDDSEYESDNGNDGGSDDGSDSSIETDNEVEVGGLADEEEPAEGDVSSDEELNELQLYEKMDYEKMYFDPLYVNQEALTSLMSDMSVSFGDSGSQAPRAEQDDSDKNTKGENKPDSLPVEGALHPSLKIGADPVENPDRSDIFDLIEAYDKDNNNMLNHKEWFDLYTNQGGKPEHTWSVFDETDADGNGELDSRELQHRQDTMRGKK